LILKAESDEAGDISWRNFATEGLLVGNYVNPMTPLLRFGEMAHCGVRTLE